METTDRKKQGVAKLDIKKKEVKKMYAAALPKVTATNRNRGGGRRPALTYEQAAELVKLYNEGWTGAALTNHYGVSRATVYKILREARS